MTVPASSSHLIEITETLVRLYVLLAQYLDRCHNDALRTSFPEQDLQAHLSATRAKLLDILSVNRVVKGKVQEECERMLMLGATCLQRGGKDATVLEQVQTERTVLRHKTIALSDLLAVFRAL